MSLVHDIIYNGAKRRIALGPAPGAGGPIAGRLRAYEGQAKSSYGPVTTTPSSPWGQARCYTTTTAGKKPAAQTPVKAASAVKPQTPAPKSAKSTAQKLSRSTAHGKALARARAASAARKGFDLVSPAKKKTAPPAVPGASAKKDKGERQAPMTPLNSAVSKSPVQTSSVNPSAAAETAAPAPRAPGYATNPNASAGSGRKGEDPAFERIRVKVAAARAAALQSVPTRSSPAPQNAGPGQLTANTSSGRSSLTSASHATAAPVTTGNSRISLEDDDTPEVRIRMPTTASGAANILTAEPPVDEDALPVRLKVTLAASCASPTSTSGTPFKEVGGTTLDSSITLDKAEEGVARSVPITEPHTTTSSGESPGQASVAQAVASPASTVDRLERAAPHAAAVCSAMKPSSTSLVVTEWSDKAVSTAKPNPPESSLASAFESPASDSPISPTPEKVADKATATRAETMQAEAAGRRSTTSSEEIVPSVQAPTTSKAPSIAAPTPKASSAQSEKPTTGSAAAGASNVNTAKAAPSVQSATKSKSPPDKAPSPATTSSLSNKSPSHQGTNVAVAVKTVKAAPSIQPDETTKPSSKTASIPAPPSTVSKKPTKSCTSAVAASVKTAASLTESGLSAIAFSIKRPCVAGTLPRRAILAAAVLDDANFPPSFPSQLPPLGHSAFWDEMYGTGWTFLERLDLLDGVPELSTTTGWKPPRLHFDHTRLPEPLAMTSVAEMRKAMDSGRMGKQRAIGGDTLIDFAVWLVAEEHAKLNGSISTVRSEMRADVNNSYLALHYGLHVVQRQLYPQASQSQGCMGTLWEGYLAALYMEHAERGELDVFLSWLTKVYDFKAWPEAETMFWKLEGVPPPHNIVYGRRTKLREIAFKATRRTHSEDKACAPKADSPTDNSDVSTAPNVLQAIHDLTAEARSIRLHLDQTKNPGSWFGRMTAAIARLIAGTPPAR